MSEPVPVTDDNSYEPGQNAAALDDRTAESEATGKVSKSEFMRGVVVGPD